MNVNEIITSKIIEELEKGKFIYELMWGTSATPTNYISNQAYSGVNLLLLMYSDMYNSENSPYWVTWNQIQDLGGKLKKGSKSTQVVFWKVDNKVCSCVAEEEGDIKIKSAPLLRYYNVFNLSCLEKGFHEIKNRNINNELGCINDCENFVYDLQPKLLFGDDRAFYRPSTDEITLPRKSQFKSLEYYYNVLFHELGHWSGAKNRMNREGITDHSMFGSHLYSKEELVAELFTCFLSQWLGFKTEKTFSNNVAYLQNWLQVFKNDKKSLIISASSQAQKAVDFCKELVKQNKNVA